MAREVGEMAAAEQGAKELTETMTNDIAHKAG